MPNISIFGDSISKGVVFDPSRQRYSILPQNFVTLAGKALSLHTKNLSRFGCTIDKGLSLVESHPEDVAASDITFLEYGGNDCDFHWDQIAQNPDGNFQPNTPLPEFTRLYGDTVDKVRAEGGNPVILNLPPIAHHKFLDWFSRGLDRNAILKWLGGSDEYIYRWHERYNDAVVALARSHNVPVVDIRSPFLALRNYADYFCEDGMHPNKAGHQLITQTLLRAAQPLVSAN